ncbi:MAG TPA: 5'-nucleotidase C-terminal domain-containing protein, partial [Thermoanaerobaculia bacterium]|nr:5'-nucleotidase C-terminal domain-containing protein [Thermoanaerobaculia bacterium]
ILGTHAHLKRALTKIPGTNTWFISPYQYLESISRVELLFDDHKLTHVHGELVPVDAKMALDAKIAERVASMQRELEADPQYAALFKPVARLSKAMSVDEVAQLAVDVMREEAKADVALSTKSSFRQPLAPGALNLEELRAALPYDNEIVVAELDTENLKKIADAFVSGTPSGPRVRVAVTDYMANVAYRELFAHAKVLRTGIRVREAVMRRLVSSWPATP